MVKNKKPLTKHFDIDLCSFGSTYVPDCEDVFSSVISVTEFDDGHGSSRGILQVVLFTQVQLSVTLGPRSLRIRSSTHCSIQNQV